MIKKLLPHLFIFTFFSVNAQTVEWVKTPSSTVNNFSTSGYISTTDPMANVYFAGFKDNPVPYTEMFGNLFYQKYSQSGELLFSKTITATAVIHQLTNDAEGNILMAIEHLDELIYEGFSIPNTTELPQNILLKVNSSGELLWHKVLTTPEVNVNTFKAIEVDALGNIYLGYDNFFYCYIEKLSPNGDPLLLITQENVNRLTSLAVDSAGNIYASGSCANIGSIYAGIEQPTSFDYSVYLVKYSAEGVFQWIKYAEDITCSSSMVKVMGTDSVYWAAETFIPLQLDDFTTEGPSASGIDFFLAKLNANGDYLWVREVPGNGSVELGKKNFLAVDDVGGIYLSGTISGGITQWNDQVTTNTITFNNHEAVLLHYLDNGLLLFAFTAGGEAIDSANSVTTDVNGDIYLTGMLQGNASLGWYNHSNNDEFGLSPFLARISPVTLSLPQPEKNTIVVYPNPVTNFLTVQTSETIVNLTVFSLNGQRMQLPQNGNQLDFSGEANGVYVVEVVMESGVERVKVVR
ncbi:T9SS type A sorting domain-containing protein [Flavobacterium azooxidireducens]|uniref:T9SS type A sorting domain-containing protein n=1 Tax=Flavobacterium azooxidireducens TaxID=1871076 RepID=A0ABY4KIU6_9FLAO|nr:T9SS type A sorting domain-containing protein [Flavobacterium azooxidireducens]UPQ80599.1 T9SS type A sorting domain-containing protein [Flavobacterium azooxidireducens]